MAMDEVTNQRWDLHTTRQMDAAKGGALAVTVLNSGSWLALLSQASSFEGSNIGGPVFAWGVGALLGTVIWLFIYRSALLAATHDYDRYSKETAAKLDNNIYWGVGVAIASLICFATGMLLLTVALI